METGTTTPDGPITEQSQFKPIISVKEARKLMGKELSEQFDDIELNGIIKTLCSLSEALLQDNLVP